MMEAQFTATFWGTRGGYPVAKVNACDFGGNTTCLEVRVGGHLIIVDAGTGIVDLGTKLVKEYRRTRKPIDAILLFTHTHHDHIQGFPFFAPTHIGNARIQIFGPRLLDEDLENVLMRSMLPPQSPVSLSELEAEISISNIGETDKLVLTPNSELEISNVHRDKRTPPIESAIVRTLHSYAHPKGGVLIYRIDYRGKSLVFATDTEGYIGGDKRLVRFARKANVLIHDGEYVEAEYMGDTGVTRQGWGHSTWNMTVEVAQLAEVEALYLTHHNAAHDDAFLEEMEYNAQKVFPNAFVAREQHTIVLL